MIFFFDWTGKKIDWKNKIISGNSWIRLTSVWVSHFLGRSNHVLFILWPTHDRRRINGGGYKKKKSNNIAKAAESYNRPKKYSIIISYAKSDEIQLIEWQIRSLIVHSYLDHYDT